MIFLLFFFFFSHSRVHNFIFIYSHQEIQCFRSSFMHIKESNALNPNLSILTDPWILKVTLTLGLKPLTLTRTIHLRGYKTYFLYLSSFLLFLSLMGSQLHPHLFTSGSKKRQNLFSLSLLLSFNFANTNPLSYFFFYYTTCLPTNPFSYFFFYYTTCLPHLSNG